MEQYIGEITTVKTNIETGEVLEYTEKNTQMNGMLRNLTAPSGANIVNTSYSSPWIQISDNTNILNRQSVEIITSTQTFNINGSVIPGEYWPQYSLDTDNNRAIFTFKQRFLPPSTGSRTINTISLWPQSYGPIIAGLKLQTPCVQTSLDILDVYYKIYVYYDPTTNADDRNVNSDRAIFNNLVSRWFSGSQYLYAEGTNTNIVTYNGESIEYISLIPTDSDLRYIAGTQMSITPSYSSTPWTYHTTTPTSNTTNNSQGTTVKSLTMSTTAYIGTLVNKIGITRWDYPQTSSYGVTLSATPISAPTDSKVQSVYLKSAGSSSTNFAYLDPSTIGSSTAELIINDSNWDDPQIPTMFKMSVVKGGSISDSTYKISMRRSFGFANNFFNTERPLHLNNLYRRFATNTFTHVNNSYNNRGMNGKRVDDKHLVTSSNTGITITNVYTGDFVNFDITSSPQLSSSFIQDAVPMPDGSILIPTLDKGLLKLSADQTNITQFTGIGDGVSDHICYTVAVKFNGDIWAMFEGALARYNTSTSSWTIYNSTTPITFNDSEYSTNWSNTLALYCRKDGGGDELLLARINSTALTWWSPTSPNPVTTTANGNMSINKFASNIRADYSKLCVNLPGTSTWFFPNYSNNVSRMVFRTNSATVVSSYTLSSYYPGVLSPMIYKGNWVVRAFDSPNSTSTSIRVRYHNETSTVLDDNGNHNTIIGLTSSTFISEVMDDYGTSVVVYSHSTGIYNAWLLNPISPLGTICWKDYGWNSTSSQWEVGNPNGKPVHTALEDLPDGLRCSFAPTGSNDFVTGERWIGYIYDGLHKDNSTNAIVNTATHARNSYITTDISSSLVPSAALGETSENFSTYTLTDDHYSWNGAVSPAGSVTNTPALSMKSELWVSGDFVFDFQTNQFAQTNSTAVAMTSYIGLYERDSSTPTSRWAFQFRGDGYAVTEDDVVKTTRSAPGPSDKFTIKRTSGVITYLVNDVVIFTSVATNTSPLRGIIRMATSDNARTFYGMKMTYSDTRRIIRIGSAVNQTGVYDTRYAMIEAWLTNPRTMKVTINGILAEVLTDPLASPLPGQVLLLQKSGLLVFNPADEGKAVTCEALVLLET